MGAWTDLGGGVRVRQSRAFLMNSGVLLDREQTILIDPGVLPSELDDIAAVAREIGASQTALFLTHPHWDHVLGRPWWPDAEIIAHDRFAQDLESESAKVAEEAEKISREHGEAWTRGFGVFRPRDAMSGLHYEHRGPWHLVFRDAPGHCDSQLTLHLPDARILFAADMLSDVEIPWLNRAPAVYRHTLEPLLVLAENGAIETLVPGHGTIARGRDTITTRIREDLAYLSELEDRAGAAARAGRDLASTTEALASMEYRCKTGGPIPMERVHRKNIRYAYEAVARER